MQMKVTRKTVAGAITIVISLMTLSVMYHGIVTGVGVIPGFSFLLWTLIALAYATHEEITGYVKENHAKVTEPLKANLTALKTSITDIAGGQDASPLASLARRLGDTRHRIRRGMITLLWDLIEALEKPEDAKPRGNP